MKYVVLLLSILALINAYAELKYVVVDDAKPMPWEMLVGDASQWAHYPALDDVDMAGSNIVNIGNAAVASLQITGGNPTNGAVLVATNTSGQMAWKRPIGRFSLKSAAKNCTFTHTQALSGTTNYIANVNLSGGQWTPRSNTYCRVDFHCWWYSVALGGIEEYAAVYFWKNGSEVCISDGINVNGNSFYFQNLSRGFSYDFIETTGTNIYTLTYKNGSTTNLIQLQSIVISGFEEPF